MLRPSYSELMETIEKSDKLDSRVTSRYTVVLAAAKRARQITNGANPLTHAPMDRAVSIAVKEMSEGKLRIHVDADLLEDSRTLTNRENFGFRSVTALSKDDLREDFKDNYEPVMYDSDDGDDGGDFAGEPQGAVVVNDDSKGTYDDNMDEPVSKDEPFDE